MSSSASVRLLVAARVALHLVSATASDATTTTTTTAYCFESIVSWEPLDMDGTLPTQEEDAHACQQRCYDTNGCYHFSYHTKFKLCHLEDAFALRRDYQSEYMSGPFQCWSYLHDAGLVQVGVQQFLPKQFSCMQVGVSWEPVMQWRTGKVLRGGQAEQILECQTLCNKTPSCMHFTMEVSTRTCKLASKDAYPVSGVFNSISGPRECNSEEDRLAFMRKFDMDQARQPRTRSFVQRWVSAGAAGLVALGVIAAALHRAKGHGPAHQDAPQEMQAAHSMLMNSRVE